MSGSSSFKPFREFAINLRICSYNESTNTTTTATAKRFRGSWVPVDMQKKDWKESYGLKRVNQVVCYLVAFDTFILMADGVFQ